ncbi:MAG: PAS domain S-box protein [Promethearchaeota archaeon]
MINDSNDDLNRLIENFKIISEQSLFGIIIIQDGKLKYFNKRVSETSGYSKEEIESWAPNDFLNTIHPEDREFVAEQARKRQLADPDVIDQYKYRTIRKNGEIAWIEIFTKTVNYEGRPAILAMTYNITEKVKAEQQLKESEEKFSKAFNSNALAMCITTFKEGIVIEANKAFLDILDISENDFKGKTILELGGWGSDQSWRETALKTLENKGMILNFESEIISPTGTGESKFGLFSFVKIELNKKPFVLTIINDITRLKLAERKLKDSKEKYLRAYNQAEFYKDLFIHDINNTLQSLYSSIQLIDMDLEDSRKNNNIKELIDIVYRQINRGTKLVSNVRKLSQLEEHEISIEEVELFDFLNRSIEFLKNSFQERKIQINIDIINEKILVRGNELLQDVFENILINSVRHNNNDIVEIIIKTSQVEQDGTTFYKLEFIDNGIGIEDERKESVLSRVYSDSKTTYGMGLGLTLVKKIIENYGGKIWIEDKVEGDYSKGTNVILLIQKGGS